MVKDNTLEIMYMAYLPFVLKKLTNDDGISKKGACHIY